MAVTNLSIQSIQERAEQAFLGLADGGRDLGHLLERLQRKLREQGYAGPAILRPSMLRQLDDTWAEHALQLISNFSKAPGALASDASLIALVRRDLPPHTP